MSFAPKKPRLNLRQGLDRDVYQVIKKLEDANDGKPFKTVTTAYEAIKRSNSSLSRQKKRPLEDALERVLDFRKQELGESDSEAEIDAVPVPPKTEDERFLLNRQMTKHWHQGSTGAQVTTTTTTTSTSTATPSENRSTKKRRIQENGEENDGRASGTETAVATPNAAQTNGNVEGGAPSVEKVEKTAVKKSTKSSRYKIEHAPTMAKLGGVADLYSKLLRQTRYLLKYPEWYIQKGCRRPTGILLSGPSGTGKKSLIRSVAANLEVPLISLTGCLQDPERMERSLNDAIDEAMRLAPCIIMIPHLDRYMAKSSGSGHSDHQDRAFTLFEAQMARIEENQPKDRYILAMATTSRVTDVNPNVLKAGLFDQTVQMRIPDAIAREDILRVVTEGSDIAQDLDFSELAKITHGFVGADIVNVVTLAQQILAERTMDSDGFPKFGAPSTDDAMEGLELTNGEAGQYSFPPPPDDPVTLDDFKLAIKDFVPSLRKEGFTVIPNITWSQVGALCDVREQLEMSVIGPIQNPEMYRQAGLNRPAGCLLWGPPGCGKTLVAQAVANEAQASFILINGPELLNKYVGESERAVRELFNRARSSTPCILFFDEIDSLVPRRDSASTEAGTRVVNALLTELDGAQDRSGVYVIGTTNRPDMIDPAMLRPGRLNVRLFVDLPTPSERVDILRAIYRTAHPLATDSEFERLEPVALDTRCNDFSGADLGGLHIKAAESALRRCRKGEKPKPEIDEEDWEKALATTARSVMNPESYRKLDVKLGKAS